MGYMDNIRMGVQAMKITRLTITLLDKNEW